MEWLELRQRWQQSPRDNDVDTMADAVHARIRSERRTVFLRDRIETLCAIVILPIFLLSAIGAWARGAWWTVAFSLFLVAWLAFVPWRLARARRALPVARREQPLAAFLAQERDALLAQARMLEQVWRWYLGPAALGVIGFFASIQGFGLATMLYTLIVLTAYVAIDRLNRRAARGYFRTRADEIRRLIETLQMENPA